MKTAKWLCVAMCVWARAAELNARRWEWSEEEHQEWRRLVELD